MSIQKQKFGGVIGGLIGIAAVIAGLALAQLVSLFNSHLYSPVISVGNRVIDHVPPVVKKLVIRFAGTHDKLVLIISILTVVLLLAALIGKLFMAGKTTAAYILLGFLILVAAGSSALNSGATIISPLPSLVAGATAVWVLRWFANSNQPTETFEEGLNRRTLFKKFAIVGVGAVAVGGVSKFVHQRIITNLERLNVALPKALKPLPTPSVDPAETVRGLSKFFTPNKDFYRIDTAISVPTISVDTWKLRIDGMVAKPMEFTYAQLLARPLIELDDTISCVSNEVGGSLVGNARWLGVSLDDLINETRPLKSADQILGHSVDGFTAGFPTAALDGRGAMIALGMNGESLPLEHGYPARVIVPGLYGYVSATKWLQRLELTRFDRAQGYWIPRGWSAMGPIKTQSRIDTPNGGSNIKPGKVAIAGIAWAPTRGISKVEVRVNKDPWREATLGPVLANTTWRQWWIGWDATKGDYNISVRATDGTGALQSDKDVPVEPNGAEGWHTVVVFVNK
jgi:DMSO/TMAO reductase YedYZ molybdopterin-dependent catalytic subunit